MRLKKVVTSFVMVMAMTVNVMAAPSITGKIENVKWKIDDATLGDSDVVEIVVHQDRNNAEISEDVAKQIDDLAANLASLKDAGMVVSDDVTMNLSKVKVLDTYYVDAYKNGELTNGLKNVTVSMDVTNLAEGVDYSIVMYDKAAGWKMTTLKPHKPDTDVLGDVVAFDLASGNWTEGITTASVDADKIFASFDDGTLTVTYGEMTGAMFAIVYESDARPTGDIALPAFMFGSAMIILTAGLVAVVARKRRREV